MAKNDQKPQPTPGEAKPDQAPKSDQKQPADPDPQGQPGQMSPQEAKSLLDSVKKDEHALPSAPDARARRPAAAAGSTEKGLVTL